MRQTEIENEFKKIWETINKIKAYLISQRKSKEEIKKPEKVDLSKKDKIEEKKIEEDIKEDIKEDNIK